jgi:hypothetical protein
VRKTKGFSYDPEKDQDVMQRIADQQNGSQYIWELVRKDMKVNSIEDMIQRQIEKYLQGMSFLAGKEKIAMDIDANDIKNILDL